MNITVNTKSTVGVWPRVEEYQNSTLRYSPPEDFPAYLAEKLGRAKIMRAWITLDEYWDYKTGEFFPDYDIGVCRYPAEELHYPYDWIRIVPAPSGTRFVKYLTTHAENADEILLNVRRLEREVLDGVITPEQYEEIFEKAVEYCKELAPNIKYIECSNEVELRGFGLMTEDEYYRIYRMGYHAVSRLNKKHDYDIPLLYGGYAKASTIKNFERWERFLTDLANDTDPDKMLDFYSVHVYNRGLTNFLTKNPDYNPAAIDLSAHRRNQLFAYLHNLTIRTLGLPKLPVFIDEFGCTGTTGVLTDSLQNASGNIAAMIGSADMDGIYLFPWCTFHNPKLQISFTQFLLRDDGGYAPTPNGNAMIMFHRLEKDRLSVQGDSQNCSVATANEENDKIKVLCTNPFDSVNEFRATLCDLDCDEITVKEYLCDSYRNNCVTGEQVNDLHVTRELTLPVTDGKVTLRAAAEPFAFVLWDITKIKKEENENEQVL